MDLHKETQVREKIRLSSPCKLMPHNAFDQRVLYLFWIKFL